MFEIFKQMWNRIPTSIKVIWILSLIVKLAFIVGLIWVIIHFVTKFW